VAVREDLALAKERHGGDGRSKNDAVVDQVPQAKDALEVGLGASPRGGWIVEGGHLRWGEYMPKRTGGKAFLSD
jgi:hypothetical protein